jgi:aspartate-semialdehyde dehydrogenase
MRTGVPLVVPEVNGEQLADHGGLIACPNCTTIGLVMALEPIRRAAGLRRVVVTTLQATSGAGRPGLLELQAQTQALVAGEPLAPETFPVPIIHNVIPLCERFTDNGYSSEEMKLVQETRKILGLPELAISVTCVRVPVPVGHSASVYLETERPLSPEQARAALAAFEGVRVIDDPEHLLFPTPADAAGIDDVLVGRVRRDLGGDGLWLFQVGDNLRKGAALNALQIAERLRA